MIRGWVLAVVTLGLFAVWSNSFVAVSYLLGSEGAARRLDWFALTAARFLPAAAVCGAYCFVWRKKESLAVLRRWWRRLLVCGFLTVPSYSLALFYAQQHGVPAPVASLTTALVPLFVMVLAALFLGERITRRRLVGFAVAVGGMALVSVAKLEDAGASYPLLVAVAALAPLSWSVHSVLSKPLAVEISPVVWTYLATFIGGLMTLPLLPGRAWRQWVELDATGWWALLYLSIPCTVLGFAVWTWLLRHLPAASVGFTVFLNPPLTALSKLAFSRVAPATFPFQIGALEWLGGALALLGLSIAVWRRGRR